MRRLASATLVAAALACSASASAASLTEGFDSVLPTGWTATNNSSPLGTSSWFQGNDAVFSSQSGATTSYIAANYNNGAGTATISDWLITPTLTFNNGDVLSFFTRTVGTPAYPDRLEVRFSNVGGTNVGTAATDVGSFTTLLLTVNPNLNTTDYPSSWTNYTATISGLSGPTSGAIAFRYFVTDGGPLGNNSDYIGIDTVSITAAPVPEPASYLMLALGLGAFALGRRRAARD
jgi:hypothetical protein